MEKHDHTVWQAGDLVATFLDGVRGAVPFAQEQIELMLKVAAVGQPAIAKVLDLGCGDGILGRAFLDAYPEAQCVFADFSQPMLTACREKLGKSKNRAKLVAVDYSQPDWPGLVADEGPFQTVISGYSIHHQPDHRKREIYGQLLTLLCPGGWFLNMEHVAPASPVTTELFNDGFVDRIAAQADARGDDSDRAAIRSSFVDRTDKSANILAPVEDQCHWLRELGYEDVDCFFKIHELALFGGRRPGVTLVPSESVPRYHQSAAIPYRWRDGKLEILVITTSKRKRWLVPKGWVEDDLTPWESAAKEAFEEAGVRGRISDRCLGTYQLRKGDGISEISVYPLQVEEVMGKWPEKSRRRRRWLSLDKAERLVQPNSLAKILRQSVDSLRPQ